MPAPRSDHRSWLKIFGGIAALFLLAPVPTFALTFLGAGWQIFQGRSGTPVLPDLAFTAFQDSLLGGTLTVDMRQFTAPNSGQLTVTAIRDFRVNGASELVTYMHHFGTTLQNGNLSVTVQITPYNINTPPPFQVPPVTRSAGDTPTFYGLTDDQSRQMGLFQGGNYRVTVTLRYTKQANGFWNNSSPHVFSFFGQ